MEAQKQVNTLSWVASVLAESGQLRGGSLFGHDGDVWFDATIDSRANCSRRLFFALPGNRTDGHNFTLDAVQKGSAAVVIERDDTAETVNKSKSPHMLVEHVMTALQDLARAYRDTLDIRVVAVTGSAGKTSTKQFIRAVLKKKYKVHSSQGSYNNHIGVPLTLLGTDPESEYLVCEVGANHRGEIDFLTRMLRPDIGVVTNVGDAHIGEFGSREHIAEAKAELFSGIDDRGCAVLPGDDEFLSVLRSRARCRVVTFGYGGDCSFKVASAESQGDVIVFTVNNEPVGIRGVGTYNVLNASAAYAVGEICGVENDRITRALADTEPIRGRGSVHRIGGIVLIDDSYNANPTSMRAALKALSGLNAKRRLAILGYMAELGSYSTDAHRELGRSLAGFGVSQVYWLGELGEAVEEGIAESKAGIRFYGFENPSALAASAVSSFQVGDAVLVKASRVVALDRVVEELTRTMAGEGAG